MKKATLGIEETLRYKRSMVIEIPDEMTESELNNILDKVQAKADTASDIPYLIEKLKVGIVIKKMPDTDTSSPSYTDTEIEELDIID